MVITYYVIDDKLLEKASNKTFDLIEHIKENILLEHEYKNQIFWVNEIVFGTFVKAWCPTIELLKLINKSEKNYIKKILDTKKIKLDKAPYLINSKNVKKVWQELKKNIL